VGGLVFRVFDPDSLSADPDQGCCWIPYGFNTDPDPDQVQDNFCKNGHICLLKPLAGHLGSRRSLQPNKEVSKYEIFTFFIFFILACLDPDPDPNSQSGSKTLP
jgi:hypothetical protein